MFVVTLIAAPLERTVVETLRDAWGGGAANWLSVGHAAEFPVPSVPGNAARVSDGLRAMGCDILVQPGAGRRRAVLLADMDSTMIGQECIDELAALGGVGDRVAAITARAMNGETGFEGAFRERVALLAGLDAGMIDRVWTERITLAPGGATLVATMRAHGGYAALVSGGFTAFTERVAAALGFDAHRANVLPVANGRITGDVVPPILGRDAKVAALRDICAARGVDAQAVLAVGDGANDLGMLAAAGAGVAMHAKPAVAAAAPLRIDHADLTALLYLQGYAEHQFVG